MQLGELLSFLQDQKNVSALVAYLIGVKRENLKSLLSENYNIVDEYDANSNSRILRCLCSIRSNIMQNYLQTENEIIYNLKNLNTIDLYKNDIKILEKYEVYIVKPNCRVNKYIVYLNTLITKYIDSCKELVPEWVEWAFVRKLFIMPNGTKENLVKNESKKYNALKNLYPYQMYINWTPSEEGNILLNDDKFLRILYAQNGRLFDDRSKVLDADTSKKTNIYNFIENNESTALVVDCENSDPYKLFAVLKNLNKQEIEKVKKIILYDDDTHTSPAWKLLKEFTDIPVEYNLIQRLKDEKSLVDIRMGAGITESYYRDNIKSFIIVSSDSDYWAIISTLPDARFLFMIEESKCGIYLKNALDGAHIYYCSIDDFCSGNISDYKSAVLLNELDKQLKELLDSNAKILLETVYVKCRIDASITEKSRFYEKYIKTLKLKIDSNYDFNISRGQ